MSKGISRRDLELRMKLLERDVDRLTTVLSNTRQLIQVMTNLGTGMSSIACATSTLTKTARDGTSKSVWSYPAADFRSQNLETLYNNVISTTKS
jgi:hypothetical protein